MSNKTKYTVEDQADNTALTAADLKYILDVNKKAIEIYIEVDQQQEKILETFNDFKDVVINMQVALEEHQKLEEEHLAASKLYNNERDADIAEIKSFIKDIDKNLFRISIILGSTGLGAIISVIYTLMKK